MKGAKLFTASLAVLALALGFFLGNFCGKCSMCCNKSEMTCCKKMEGPCPRQGMMPPPGSPHHPGEFKGPGHHGDFKGPKFKHKMDPTAIDSMLEVTPEQKAALDANRAKGDSIFKELRENKHEAEKALGQALENNDPNAIEVAKAQVLEADKALLEHRINGVAALSKILSKEQLDKFNQFRKEQMNKFKELKKNGRPGPQGNPPPPPPQP